MAKETKGIMTLKFKNSKKKSNLSQKTKISKRAFKYQIIQEIPKDFPLKEVYNPCFDLRTVVSISPHSPDKNPPRPMNQFFLFKKVLLKVLRDNGYRCTMPTACRISQIVWRDAPKEAKQFYAKLSHEALKLHLEAYPHYKYKPARSLKTKTTSLPGGMLTTFSIHSKFENPCLEDQVLPWKKLEEALVIPSQKEFPILEDNIPTQLSQPMDLSGDQTQYNEPELGEILQIENNLPISLCRSSSEEANLCQPEIDEFEENFNWEIFTLGDPYFYPHTWFQNY
ncbi:hypothetical protein G9A89_010923 [Geosiphon pyriformis]|nr:hypothetical protein G9A89_010923 [Geosiphon pyriformis]